MAQWPTAGDQEAPHKWAQDCVVTSTMLTPLCQVAACILRRRTAACTVDAAAGASKRCRPITATTPSELPKPCA